jgi:plastocyanin
MSLPRRLLRAAGGLGVALTGCRDGGPNGTGSGATTTDGGQSANVAASVSMIDTSFQPRMTGVEPVPTVEWTNRDSFAHDVTAARFHDAAADGDLAVDVGPGEIATHSFDAAGVSEYTCTVQGKASMCGAVLVGDASLDESLPCEGAGASGGLLTRPPTGGGLSSPTTDAGR